MNLDFRYCILLSILFVSMRYDGGSIVSQISVAFRYDERYGGKDCSKRLSLLSNPQQYVHLLSVSRIKRLYLRPLFVCIPFSVQNQRSVVKSKAIICFLFANFSHFLYSMKFDGIYKVVERQLQCYLMRLAVTYYFFIARLLLSINIPKNGGENMLFPLNI